MPVSQIGVEVDLLLTCHLIYCMQGTPTDINGFYKIINPLISKDIAMELIVIKSFGKELSFTWLSIHFVIMYVTRKSTLSQVVYSRFQVLPAQL